MLTKIAFLSEFDDSINQMFTLRKAGSIQGVFQLTKSNNIQIEDILNNIYNLILNPETTEEERNLLVTFKNEIEVGKKDNGELLAELRRAIQVLAVDNLSKGISLSSGLSELSKTLTEFQNESERNANLAIGLSSIAMFLR